MYDYVPINDTSYQWFFNEPKVSDEDLQQIQPLTEDCSSKIWTKHISNQRHLALVRRATNEKEHHWINSLERLDYDWEEDWNADDMKSLGIFLNNRFDISEDESVLFFWMREDAVKTKWGTFLKNWINFLYEDEAPVLFIESKNIVIVFGPGGVILAGEKDSKED